MNFLVSSLVIVAMGAAAAPTTPPSLDWIIEQHTRARGGRAAIEAVRAVQMDITISEPTYAADGRYVASRDGSMRIDVFIDGDRVFTEALEHGQTWSRAAGETTAATAGTAAGATALRHGVEEPFKLFGLHEMQARGHRLTFEGRSVVDGTKYYVVEATLDDGYRTSYYLNPATWLIERERQYRALHVDADPTPEWIETRFEDYRAVAGVQYPWRQVERQLATDTVLSTTIVRDIVVNPAIDPALFVGPAGG